MRTRPAVLGIVLGFTLAASAPSHAAWRPPSSTVKGYASAGTWCTPGSLTLAMSAGSSSAADTWIDQSDPNTPQSGEPRVGTSDDERALYRWQMPSIPAGCAPTQDTVTLTVAAGPSSSMTVSLLPLMSSFDESTVSWVSQPAFGSALTSTTITTTASTASWTWAAPAGSITVPWTDGIELQSTASSMTTFVSRESAGGGAAAPTLTVSYA